MTLLFSSLHSDFTVNFNEVLKVNVVEWPYSIELQVCACVFVC